MAKTAAAPCRLGFLLIDGFTMIAFANAIEPFRMANYASEQTLYTWKVAGLAGQHTAASNGLQIQHTDTPEGLLECDLVLVCGGYQIQHLVSPAIRLLLQRLAARDIALGGVCTGALALADAGVLDSYQASLHWENFIAAQESYPGVAFRQNLYTIDRNRYTCSGGASALDMAQAVIRQHHGRVLAAQIAEYFDVAYMRTADSLQHAPAPAGSAPGYEHVADAVALMQANIEEPLTLADVAELCRVSPRQLQRLFQRYHQTSPAGYYLQQRLRRARELLQQTSLSITDISIACGFLTVSSFSKAFRKQYGYPPTQQRKEEAA
ncbi:GlxA family transcriptional regulator [Uruburuella testudinis]|uniref:GlxA family transcriptional regulator n=1 Tax=Uruburuella testudinis TaxID=1282863 RepID=A0ABY4DTI8_9NEIS|nr:GlxA family transcriptional regulator [Uruburuella testudinis]UOO81718.1 GlxA family transcriptional regulator [Uruburuella testudinis]